MTIKGKRKIRQGERITSLNQLTKCEWVMVKGEPYSRGWWCGWWCGWLINTALMHINMEVIYEGIRLTNGEYYDSLTDDELAEKFEDEIGLTGILPWDYEYAEKIKTWKEHPVK